SAFVDVTVTSANTAPVAVDDSVTLVQGTSLDIDVVANDSDADGDDLTPSILTQPVHGAAMLQGGAIRYTPDVGYVGVDQFDYTIADGNEGMDTATVFISITPAEFSETQHSVGMTTLVYHDGAFYNVFHESRAGDADVYLRTSEDGIAWSDRVLVSDGLPGTSQHSGSVAV